MLGNDLKSGGQGKMLDFFSNISFFTILILLILFFLYGIFYSNYENIIIVSKDILPKVLGSSLLISLALIAIIFSIHADVFSSYDKHNTNSNPQYDWFNVLDILKFPSDQYEINVNNEYPETLINLTDTLYSKKSRKITIILDKTGSINLNVENENYRRSLKKELSSILTKKVDKNCFTNTEFLKVEDLFLLASIAKFSEDTSSFKETILQIIIYTGYGTEPKSKGEITHYELPINHENINDLKLQYVYEEIIKSLNKVKKDKTVINSRSTNFSDLAKILNYDNFLNNKKYKSVTHNSLIILSDFVHQETESKDYFYDVIQNLDKINNLVDQVNLISFNSSNKEKVEIARKTKNIFRKTFNDLYFYEFEEYLNTNLPNLDQINRMFCTTSDDSNPVILYNSFDNESYKHDYVGKIHLKFPSTDSIIIGYGNRVKPHNYIGEYNYLKIKNDKKEEKIYPFQVSKISLNETYGMHYTNDSKTSKNNFLELNIPNNTQIIRKPLILRPVLPKTSCIYLICLYFITSILILTIITYYISRTVNMNHKKEGNGIWVILLLFVLLLLPLIITILYSNIVNLFILKEIKILLLILFCSIQIIPLFKFSLKYKST